MKLDKKNILPGISKKRMIIFTILCMITMIMCIIANKMKAGDYAAEESSTYVRAVVSQVLSDHTEKDEATENMLRGSQDVIVKILTGENKGKEYLTTNYVSALYNTNAQLGTKVIVRLDKTEEKVTAFIYCYDRINILLAMILIFFALITMIGRRKGIAAMIALIYSIFLIFSVLFPFLLHGMPVLLTSIGMIILMTIMTFTLIEEMNKKTISACIGTILGVIVAGVFAYISGLLLHVNGFNTTESEELLLLGRDHGMRLKDLFVAGILFAALGAVMDVAMSIASAIHEMKQIDTALDFGRLWKSGMNIGRDAMGTMANTLILAFVGSSFTLLLLMYTYQLPILQVLNTDLIARECMQGIAGSIGIILTVPIVAGTSAYIESR